MAEYNKKPAKGILKNTSSFDRERLNSEGHTIKDKEMKWDEMNILATYHPADKDYGHDKINEPPTPYNPIDPTNEGDDTRSGDETEICLDPNLIAQSLSIKNSKPKFMQASESCSDDEEIEEENLTEEEIEKKKAFLMHRKKHYNEFEAVRIARQLLQNEDEDDEDSTGKGTIAKEEEIDDADDENDGPIKSVLVGDNHLIGRREEPDGSENLTLTNQKLNNPKQIREYMETGEGKI